MTPPDAITTDALARSIGIQPGTIRIRLCRTGSYFGLRPTKLPNGRLLWPADSLEQLTGTRTGRQPVAPRKDGEAA